MWDTKIIIQKIANKLGYHITQKKSYEIEAQELIEDHFLDVNRTLLISMTRYELLNYLSKQTSVAEVGVAEGGFSSLIWDTLQPKKLFLIDPWCFQNRADYLSDPINQEDQIQKQRYLKVKKRFNNQIKEGRVVIHRNFSNIAADQIEDKTLDWVYIDALHSYDAVTEDLEVFSKKIKDDGFIMGHDFANHEHAKLMGFGVVEAVRDFVKKHSYHLVLVTNEAFPTYLISTKRNNKVVAEIISKLIKTKTVFIEVPSDIFLLSQIQHKYIRNNNGLEEVIYSII